MSKLVQVLETVCKKNNLFVAPFRSSTNRIAVVHSRSREDLKFGHFTLLFCRRRQRNVPKCKTHVPSEYLPNKPIVLVRYRCRCRPRCLS